MDLIASFSSQTVRSFHFFKLKGLIHNQIMNFLFDTGAAFSVIGVNHLLKPGQHTDEVKKQLLREAFIKESKRQGIKERGENLRAANNAMIVTYPCICHGVSIEGAAEMDFCFDFALSDINLPLLGGSFMNDCTYSHSIDGSVIVSGMKDNPGMGLYRNIPVVDFNRAVSNMQKDGFFTL